jgi:uncharacterized protein with FMN-binding domain
MKKAVLSLLVIFGFIGYSYYIKVNKSLDTGITVGQSNGKKVVTVIKASPPPALSSQTPTITGQSQKTNSLYKDGSFTGSVADAVYGNIQVKVTILNGKITNITFLQHPHDQDTSVQINQQSDPMLAQEAIQQQSAQVDIVSGATQTSQAFIESLQQALVNAKS